MEFRSPEAELSHAERGLSLIEVLVAVAILSAASLSMTGLVRGHLAAGEALRARERELEDESRLLAAYTLLNRGELDLRLGSTDAGRYRVLVTRPTRSLYRIAIARGESREHEDLVTVVYRAAP